MNLRGFVTLVDAVGGVEVTLEHPLRDEHAHIDLPAGTQRLDGRTALGFARSRQGDPGRWNLDSDPEGAAGQRRGGEVFRLPTRQLPRNPVHLYSLAWQTLPETSLSEGRPCSTWRVFTTSVVDSQVSLEGQDAEDWVAWPTMRPGLLSRRPAWRVAAV